MEVSARVFAAGTVRIRVVVNTPQAHTLEQTLTGAISVAPDGTLVGNALATADRYNGVHVRAPAIFLPRSLIYFAPPADLMPAGKTWARITPAVPNGRASYAAREAAYVLYASATSWNLIRYATNATQPHWSGTGTSARANMSGTVALANALPHATPGARDAVITFAGPGTKNATWHVVLDSRLLPVSCVITAYSPALGPITATVTYSNWGTPVHASTPPAPEIATYSELPPYLREVAGSAAGPAGLSPAAPAIAWFNRLTSAARRGRCAGYGVGTGVPVGGGVAVLVGVASVGSVSLSAWPSSSGWRHCRRR